MRRVTGLNALPCALVLTPAAAVAVNHDGDITVDNAVDTADLLWAIQAVLGSRTLTTEQEQLGDFAPLVDGSPQPDGTFNLGDVVVITRHVLGGLVFSVPAPPANQFNIGDSIGEGEAANGTIGQAHHHWSTGRYRHHYGAPVDGVLRSKIISTIAVVVFWRLIVNLPGRDSVNVRDAPVESCT
ncbi:MAG: dockerin type I repeat-containing protein [Gammaproteobacteria bacterium]